MSFVARGHPQQVNHPHPGQEGLWPEAAVPFDIDDRGTDPGEFAMLDQRFHFTIDVAASHHNAKCERYYTIEGDGLVQPWGRDERVWCNPPYSNLYAWVEKAWHEFTAPDPAIAGPVGPELIVMLVPANRTEQRWWQESVEPMRDKPTWHFTTEFLPGRMRFTAPGTDRGVRSTRPPFGCCLLIWSR